MELFVYEIPIHIFLVWTVKALISVVYFYDFRDKFCNSHGLQTWLMVCVSHRTIRDLNPLLWGGGGGEEWAVGGVGGTFFLFVGHIFF
jgi:hypothetical protein